MATKLALRQNVLPEVSTSSATNITTSSATLGGNITSVGVPAYTEKGVCYSTSSNPIISNTKLVASGNGTTGNYTVNATGLAENTTYYARAYATNSQGTAYGSQVSFKTASGAQIRFSKNVYSSYAQYFTDMKVYENGNYENTLATYHFGASNGTSPYYTVTAGDIMYNIYMLESYSGYPDGWRYWIAYPGPYTLSAGRKYTLTFTYSSTSSVTMDLTDNGGI